MITINKRKIGPNHKPYIIAELSANHNNDLDLAKLSKDFSNTNKELQYFLKQFSTSYSPLGPKLSSATDEVKIAIAKINLIK